MSKSVLLAAVLSVLIGCDSAPGPFPANDLYTLSLAKMRRVEPTDAIANDAALTVQEWFGTPAQPRWPDQSLSSDASKNLVSLDNLSRSAGQIRSDRDNTHQGLYREHCVNCHGVDGGGNGPAALFQNPYPRNLKHGVFKWKSTERTAKPTRDDLDHLLVHGVRGSAMPSFAMVPENDREALIDYVIYLAVRGEVERGLIAAAIDDLGYDEDTIENELRLSPTPNTEGGEVAAEILNEVAESWTSAGSDSIPVPQMIVAIDSESVPNETSIENGRAIFHGQIANCTGCHGTAGNADVVTIDYDDWTKEYSTRIGISPEDRDAFRPLKKMGALPPRLAAPRKLDRGVYRGGGDAATLYRRITQGIAGTPMPAVAVSAAEDGRGLTVNQIADLIRYVQSLNPNQPSPTQKLQ